MQSKNIAALCRISLKTEENILTNGSSGYEGIGTLVAKSHIKDKGTFYLIHG